MSPRTKGMHVSLHMVFRIFLLIFLVTSCQKTTPTPVQIPTPADTQTPPTSVTPTEETTTPADQTQTPIATPVDCGDNLLDTDGDGWADQCDNCPQIANHDQEDSDGDGIGNACANDPDGDGYSNEIGEAGLDPNTYPGAREICDGRDNDGDDVIDEDTGCEVLP